MAMSAATRRKIIERDGVLCWYCGQDATPTRLYATMKFNSPALDHKTPLLKGGTNELDNLVVACTSCNTRKGTRTVEEYRQYLLLYRSKPARALHSLRAAVKEMPSLERFNVKDMEAWLQNQVEPIVFHGEAREQPPPASNT